MMDEGLKVIRRTKRPAATSSLWHEQAEPIPGESYINLAASRSVIKSEENCRTTPELRYSEEQNTPQQKPETGSLTE